jgi:hypothetical protein
MFHLNVDSAPASAPPAANSTTWLPFYCRKSDSRTGIMSYHPDLSCRRLIRRSDGTKYWRSCVAARSVPSSSISAGS